MTERRKKKIGTTATSLLVVLVLLVVAAPARGFRPMSYSGPHVLSSAWGVSGQFANGSGYENFTVISGSSLVATAWGAFVVHNNSPANGLCSWFMVGSPFFRDTHNLSWTTAYCFTFSARTTNGSSGQVGHFFYCIASSSAWAGANGTDEIKAFFNSSIGNESVTPFGINGLSLLNVNETVAVSTLGNGSVNSVNATSITEHASAALNSLLVASDVVSLAGTTSGERGNSSHPLRPFANATVSGTVNVSALSAGNPEFWSGQVWDQVATAATITTTWRENISVHQGALSVDFVKKPPVVVGGSGPGIGGIVALVLVGFLGSVIVLTLTKRSRIWQASVNGSRDS